ENLVAKVRSVAGVADAEGQITGYGTLLGKDGKGIGGNGPPRQAGSWVEDPTLNPYRLVEGHAPRGPGEVVINRGAAKAGGLHLGDRTVVQTPQPIPVKVVGIATFGDADGFGTATFTAFSLPEAQKVVTRQADAVSTIVVRGDSGVSSNALRDRVRAVLPHGVQAITGTQLANERIDSISSGFLGILKTFLVVFAGIALIVATLSISNTFSITVAQRTRELALLRAVGATKRQVRALVALEALLIGAVSGALGIVAGLGVAGLLKGMFDVFGFALPAGGLTVHPAALVIGFVVGVVATVVAAQLPARRASAIAPVAALRDAGAESVALSRRRVLVALGVLAGGAVLAAIGVSAGQTLTTGIGALALTTGTLLVAPVVLTPAARLIGGAFTRVRGVTGRLAVQNARRNPRRSATTATALVIGVAVVSLFTLFTASLKATLDDEVRNGVKADLVVATPSFGGGQLSPELATDLAHLPSVAQAVGMGGGPVELNRKGTVVTATDTAQLPAVLDLGGDAAAVRALGPAQIAVTRSTAKSRHWRVGSPVTLTFPGGASRPVKVGALFDSTDLLSDVVVPDRLFAAGTVQPTAQAVFVNKKPGASLDETRRAITPLATRDSGNVQTVAEFASSSSAGLDTLLNIVYVMLALAILIALLGIANTLSLAVYERRRELGLLRAVGETRRQVRSMLRLESVIVATFGTALGLGLGVVLGGLLFLTVSDTGTVAFPGTQLAIIAILGAFAGVLAALRPARRAARLPILDAIADA
ncbi:MAG: transporter substrate-binding protein, partial [Actinomycetia bacterium]|nr:transporter substrate-binding protein [Actinomycetes bacterium]